MIQDVRKKFEDLTSKRNALLQRLESLTTDTLSFKSGPDKWSVIEVVEHLVIAEEDFFKQASTQATPFDNKTRSPEKYKTVIKVMERDIPVDVPDESLEPLGCSTLKELLSRWNNVREKLQEFLDGINSDNKDDLVYRHPFAGPLNIQETLQFIDVHFDNHMRHINRILAEMP
jgi:uncharacterized damage-inducible protein DinB